MNKKTRWLLVILVAVITGAAFYLKANTCKDIDCRVEAKCKGHLLPRSDTLNIIKSNGTIVFVEYEREGVARHAYEYYKDIDPAFFKNIDEESFLNQDEAGGYRATVGIYKALKKGDTEILLYKKPSRDLKQANDTAFTKPETEATYKFHIE
jgi:hypothetical protein